MIDTAMRALCQRHIADQPRWLEAHGLLADPTASCEQLEPTLAPIKTNLDGPTLQPGAWLLRHDAAGLAVVVGEPSAAAWTSVLHQHCSLAILFDDGYPALTTAAQTIGRNVVGVSFALLDDAMPAHDGATILHAEESLDHVEPVLRAELARVRHDRTIWTVRVDDQPVSFAYAGWRSPTWFDVSVDTLREFRQLGLATSVAAALVHDEMSQGRQAVWGASDDNIASQRLAAKLGFAPHSRAAMVAPQVVPSHAPQVARPNAPQVAP